MPENVTNTVSSVETERRLTVYVDVTGAPVEAFRKTRFAPSHVTIELARVAGQTWKPRRIEVSGPNVKADGSIGANRHEKNYTYWDFGSQPDWNGTPPQWLLDLVAEQLDSLASGLQGGAR